MRDGFLPEEKLAILRKQDDTRRWYSLDDKRVCIVCERIFSGRQIEFDRLPDGRTQLKCPSEDCPSDISHWLLFRLPVDGQATVERKGEFSFL